MSPSLPRPSATVVLLRDADSGPEVLLVLRHADASFGASYVFPGGVNDAADAAVADRCDGLDDVSASRRLGLASGGLAYYSSAIRELFEETGILLATASDAAGRTRLVADNALDRQRVALHAGKLAWPDFLATNELRLPCDRLHYFAYWVTPRHFAKRYSTRFFAATLPAGQEGCHDGRELTDSCWLAPRAALDAARGDEIKLPPPTRATLTDLAPCATAQAALDWAAARGRSGVNCVMPAIVGDGDARRVVLPDSPDYPRDHRGCEA